MASVITRVKQKQIAQMVASEKRLDGRELTIAKSSLSKAS
jgi:hypothetical protein